MKTIVHTSNHRAIAQLLHNVALARMGLLSRVLLSTFKSVKNC